jgi:hypothetical protein
MRTLNIISIIIGLCYCGIVQGQDFKQDIEKINATYQSATRFQMEMDYNLYVSHHSTKVYESTSALIFKDKYGYYSKMFEQEMIINKDYVILLDHDSELFMIDRFQQSQINKAEQELISNDSLMNLLKTMITETSPAIQEVKASPGKYIVIYNYGELEKMELNFNTTSYQFEKVIMYYRDAMPILDKQSPQKPRLEIVYRKFDTDPIIPNDLFSEKKYARIDFNKSLSPKGKMKNYTVINHLWDSHSQN